MVFVPVAIGRRLESKKPGEPRRGLNLGIAVGLTVARRSPSAARSSRTTRPGSRSTGRARRSRPCARELEPDDRVFAPDRFSDWMLFKIPELRGRIAYDVRFELYDRGVLRPTCRTTTSRPARTGSRSRTATTSCSSDETTKSHTADFLAEPGARVIYATTRSRSSSGRVPIRALTHGVLRLLPIAGGTRARPRARTPSTTPDRVRGERRTPARARDAA